MILDTMLLLSRATNPSLRGNPSINSYCFRWREGIQDKMSECPGFSLNCFAEYLSSAAELLLAESADTNGSSGRALTVDLSSTAGRTLASNAIYILPAIGALLLVDSAIFGAYADERDKLNPVSKFFYHTKRGFNSVRSKSSLLRPIRPLRVGRFALENMNVGDLIKDMDRFTRTLD